MLLLLLLWAVVEEGDAGVETRGGQGWQNGREIGGG